MTEYNGTDVWPRGAEKPSIPTLECPIRPGMALGGWFGRKILEVGEARRVGGGWIAPVRVRKKFHKRYALARYFIGSGSAFSIDKIEAHRSTNHNAQVLLEHSSIMPAWCNSEDPGILLLNVTDRASLDDGFEYDVGYQITLRGITGHFDETDSVCGGY